MLKTKPLTQLLSQSISPNVSSALLFTPSGSLLATGTSPIAPDAKKARTNAALAANIWSTYASTIEDDDGLKTLTLEFDEHNMHIALVAPRVLLCLIGPTKPNTPRYSSSRSSAHSQGSVGGNGVPGSAGALGSARPASVKAVAGGGLGLLKTQAQALVQYLEKELGGYELPEGL